MPRGDHRCSHVPATTAAPKAEACESCGTAQNRRVCLTCGFVGCCESQQGHAEAHAKATGHHVISAMPITHLSFCWCYACETYVVGPVDHPAAQAKAKQAS